MEVKEHVIRSCRYLLLPVVRFLLKHGVVDCIIDRRELRDRIANMLGMLMHRQAS